AKLMAPLAPFSTEDIWFKLRNEKDLESVHLCDWPEAKKHNEDIVKEMQIVRDYCNIGNMLRKKENIPIKQPLATFFVPEPPKESYQEVMKDELNVKNIQKSKDENITFDTTITKDLKTEGDYRELVRAIQDIRKKEGLMPSDMILLNIKTGDNEKDFINKFKKELLKTVGAKEITFSDTKGVDIKIG